MEVETGKGHDALDRRPQLAAALARARRLKAGSVETAARPSGQIRAGHQSQCHDAGGNCGDPPGR